MQELSTSTQRSRNVTGRGAGLNRGLRVPLHHRVNKALRDSTHPFRNVGAQVTGQKRLGRMIPILFQKRISIVSSEQLNEFCPLKR
jgi:hypothetical protein